MPGVSVIMGVHNGGRWLAGTVRSVLQQTYPDWELIMVDNGSNDGAVGAVVRDHPDERIRVLQHDAPLGSGPALNTAAAAARGRYLAVLDKDDLAMPRRLELQCAYLDWRTEVGLLGAASLIIDGDGKPLAPEPFTGRHEELHAMLSFINPLRHSSVMFRRELLDRVSYRALAGPAADMDFLARASETARMACLPEILCHYRWHPANMSHRSLRSMAMHGALVRMLIRRRRSGQPEEAARWTEAFHAILAGEQPLAASYQACARLFRRERHHDLAAFYSWLAWREAGGWLAGAHYWRHVVAGLWSGRGARSRLFKAWMKEPAHQLLREGGMPERMQF